MKLPTMSGARLCGNGLQRHTVVQPVGAVRGAFCSRPAAPWVPTTLSAHQVIDPRAQNVAARSYSNRSGAGAGAGTVDPADPSKRAQDLIELLQEAASIVLNNGSKGVFRTVQGSMALLSLTQEYITTGQLEPAPVSERQLRTISYSFHNCYPMFGCRL